MRSHLTPYVFRELLSSRGLTLRCPFHSQITFRSRLRPRHVSPAILRDSARRTLFSFARKPERQPKEPDLDPGLREMIDYALMERIQARPPPADVLIKAWRKYFEFKRKDGSDVNNTYAKHVLKNFLHLQKLGCIGGKDELGSLDFVDLRNARDVLARIPNDGVEEHNKLARILYKEIQSAAPAQESESFRDIKRYVQVLSLTGDAAEARQITQDFWREKVQVGKLRGINYLLGKKLWWCLLYAYAKDGNETELLNTCAMAEALGMKHGGNIKNVLTSFYAERNDVEATKMWYKRFIGPDNPRENALAVSPVTLKTIYKFCLRNDEMEWCKEVFRDLLQHDPKKAIWDQVLQWAAGTMGKGVEDVEQMMNLMEEKSTEQQPTIPDIDTINGLVELCMGLNNLYLAERYMALGLKRGIHPNAQTFILQMNYRVDAKDVTGAGAAYESLRSEEVHKDEDLPAINKYIRALCAAKGNHYDRIVSVCSDIQERNARLEAKTVSALAVMYLNRNELQDLIDMLQTHAYHFTLDERNIIKETFVKFCLATENSTERVWDSYTIMRQLFDETSTETKTELMEEFFRRKRCDMACHVFGHMRQHIQQIKRPLIDTYIQCFEGIARCEDYEFLRMVHNMLKMDSFIEVSTKLHNALMLAYTACGDSSRAVDFWDDITNSNEGPSHRSLEIVFWACEKKPFGDELARDIWKRMRRMDIEITQEMFHGYLGALSGQGNLEEAKSLVESMKPEFGLDCQGLTLGTLYNATPGQNRKDLVEDWAKAVYPETWRELLKVGRRNHREGHKVFKISRKLRA